MNSVVHSVGTLLVMILVGTFLSRRKVITPALSRAMVTILLQIALPFLILSSFLFSYDEAIKASVLHTFYYSAAAYGLTIVLSRLLLVPIRDQKKTILHFATVFSNTGYVGFPILNAVYGSEGVVYGSVFNMFFVILVWTYGIFLYRGPAQGPLKEELRRALFNPSILAVAAGILIMLGGVRLPQFLVTSIEALGSMTGPLSMLVTGSLLAEVKLRDHLRDWTIYYGTATRLVILPLILYFIAAGTGLVSKVTNTIVIMTAMPAATMTSIFAQHFEADSDYAAVVVAATTIASLFTMPVLLRSLL